MAQQAKKGRRPVRRVYERWRAIPGYDGMYEVNDMGVIRSWRDRHKRGRAERAHKLNAFYANKSKGKGLAYVRLTGPGGKRESVAVSRIVADAWMGGCPPGMVIYHKNGCGMDNSVYNLAFMRPQQMGRILGRKYGGRRVVAKLNAAGEIVEFYPSIRVAARENHMSETAMYNCCNGRRKDPFFPDGYTYQYNDED